MNKEKLAHEISEMQQRLAEMEDELVKDSGDEFEEGQWVFIKSALCGSSNSEGDVGRITEVSPTTCRVMVYSKTDSNLANNEIRDSLRPATEEEIKEALVAEAKRRGYTLDNFKCLVFHTDNTSELQWSYDRNVDILYMGHNAVYVRGQWAEIVEDTVTINGVECEVLKGHIKLSCGDYFPIQKFRHFLGLVEDYDLTVMRQGEDITPQIKKLGEQI